MNKVRKHDIYIFYFSNKFTPEGQTPYEVPEEALKISPEPEADHSKLLYHVEITDDPFSLKITRNNTDKTAV